MWYYAFRKHKLVTAKQIQETKRKEERGMRGMLIMFCSTTAAAGTFVCVLAARRMVDRGTLLTISGVLLGMLAQLALFGLMLARG